jgi:hypothetical protein
VIRWIVTLLGIAAAVAQAQQYTGPQPEKPDLPYLKHANVLVATEPVEIKETKTANDVAYSVEGETSPSKTPLALPVFLIRAEKLDPAHLQIFRLEVKDGHREMTLSGRKQAGLIHVQVVKVQGSLFRMEVADDLETGEYVLSLDGTDRGFCFGIK